MIRRSTLARGVTATLVSVAALAGATATTTSAGAYSSTATCASVVQLVARGSNETAGTPSGNVYSSGGLGRMSGIASAVASGKSTSVRTAGLNYPATIGWGGTAYLGSLNTGRDRLAAEIRRLASLCPSSKLVLIGYSQGAHVIGDVMSNSNPEGLTSTQRSKVAAVFLTGDPVRRPNEPHNRGTGAGGGVLIDRGAGQMSSLGSRIQSYCYYGDNVCDAPRAASNGATIHGSYGNSTLRSYAASFILSKL